MTNAFRHSGAHRVKFGIDHGNSTISICLKDEGVGFMAGESSSNGGVANMKMRAGKIGASIQLDTINGTQITLTLQNTEASLILNPSRSV